MATQEDIQNAQEYEDALKRVGSSIEEMYAAQKIKSSETIDHIKNKLSSLVGEAEAKKLEDNWTKAYGTLEKKANEAFQSAEAAASSFLKSQSTIFDNLISNSSEAAQRVAGAFDKTFKTVGTFTFLVDAELKGAAQTDLKGSLGDLMDASSNFLSQNAVDMGQYFVFQKVPEMIKGALPKQLLEVEKNFADMTSTVGQGLAGMRGSIGSGERAGVTFGDNVARAFSDVGDAMANLGVDSKTARTELGALYNAGLQAGELPTIEIETGDASQNLRGLSAQMAIARATGQDVGEVAKVTQQNLRRLGRSANEIDDIFGAMSLAQEGTNLSFGKVQETLMSSADSLAFYGTKVESMTGLFNSMVSSMGKGREALGADLFKAAVSGIQGMSDGMKGFIGLTTGLAGPGGALGAILDFEDALAEGRMDEVIGKVQQSVEQITGGKILTREESKEQGKETQFFMQRKILQQQLGISDPGQLRELQNFLGGGQRKEAGDILKGLPAAKAGLAGEGRAIAQAEVGGPMNAALNRAGARAEMALGELSTNYLESSQEIGQATENVIQAFTKLGDKAAQGFATDVGVPGQGDVTTEGARVKIERTRADKFSAAEANSAPAKAAMGLDSSGNVKPSMLGVPTAGDTSSPTSLDDMGLMGRGSKKPSMFGVQPRSLNVDALRDVQGYLQNQPAAGAVAPGTLPTLEPHTEEGASPIGPTTPGVVGRAPPGAQEAAVELGMGPEQTVRFTPENNTIEFEVVLKNNEFSTQIKDRIRKIALDVVNERS